jgi:acetylglutamate kinase
LALDENGVPCNVNADEAAASLAAGLQARLLIMTDTDGVLDEQGRSTSFLDAVTVERLISDGAIRDGMVPKVRGALSALERGATEVLIANGLSESAVARALDGSLRGTRIEQR